MRPVTMMLWLELLLLAATLALGGLLAWRRLRSRRVLVARVKELSLLADIGRAILDAPPDLTQLAEVVYEQAGKIIDTRLFQLGLFEEDRYRLLFRIVDGVRQPAAEFRLTPGSLGISGWVRDSRQSLLVRDFEAERDTLPAKPRYLSDLPPKSGVFVPLLVGDTVLGVTTIQSWQPAAFTENDLRLLTIVANYAAAALEKGRLLEQARRQADQLQHLAEVSQQLNALQPLPDMYRQVVRLAADKFGDFDVSYFAVEGDQLRLAATTRPEWLGQTLRLTAGQGITGEAAAARQPVVRQELPDFGPGDGAARPENRAELAVPVEIAGRLLGVLNAQSRECCAVDDVVVALFKSLAAQMAMTILEGEAYQAEQRRLAQLTAIGLVSRAVASMLEMSDLLDEVLDLLGERFGYRRARIFLRQEDQLVYQAGTVRGATRLALQGLSIGIDEPGLIALSARSRQPVVVNDVAANPDYVPDVDMKDTQAEIAVPLIMGRELEGVIDVQSERANVFTNEDVQTLQALADTLAVAVRNAQLFEAERRRRRLAETLREVSAALAATLDLDDVLDLILSGLAGVVTHDVASVLLANDAGELELRATRGSENGETLVGRTLGVKLFPPGETFPPTVPFSQVDERGEYQALLGLESPSVCLGAVLALRGEHWGYLVVGRLGSAQFRRGETELVSAFAAQATVAIENARLYASQQEETWISTALLQVAEAMVARPTLDEALATVARLTPLLVGVGRIAIYQWDGTAQQFTVSEVMGLTPAEATALRAQRLQAADLGIVAGEANVAAAPVRLPPAVAQAFSGDQGMVWPLRARGDLLGALVIEGLPDLGRRQSILDGIAHQLAMAMESARLARDLAAQQRLELELGVARDIQESFLPDVCPRAPGWELCASWRAAQQVGGDFYDFIPLRVDPTEPRWGIVIADVAGKGVPAALFMAMSRTILRSAAISRVSPAATLARANQLILNDTRSDLFVTMFYAVWEPAAGRLVYANAGHNAPLFATGEGTVKPLPGGGMVLGVAADTQYAEHEVHLQPGDLLLLYTDGLTDAINAAEEEFGLERVQTIWREAYREGTPAVDALERLSAAVQAFAGPAGTFDDVTMVALRRLR